MRTVRATRSRRVRERSFFDRYRTLIYGGLGALGVLLIGWLFFFSSAGAAYTCDSLLTPGPSESLTPRPPTPTPSPTPSISPSPSAAPSASGSLAPSGSPSAVPSGSPVPSASATASPSASPSPTASPSASPSAAPTPEATETPRLGFTTRILGAEHVRDRTINYGFCPPTSGEHYNAAGRGPIRADVYPRTDEVSPGGWVHNLEHGYIVVLYKNTAEDPITDAEFQQLETFWDQVPQSANASCPRKLVVARFDNMETPFAILAWGRALLLDEWNMDTANTFAQQWTDHEAVPERGSC